MLDRRPLEAVILLRQRGNKNNVHDLSRLQFNLGPNLSYGYFMFKSKSITIITFICRGLQLTRVKIFRLKKTSNGPWPELEGPGRDRPARANPSPARSVQHFGLEFYIFMYWAHQKSAGP